MTDTDDIGYVTNVKHMQDDAGRMVVRVTVDFFDGD